jgi:hypothetical protein
VSGRPPFGGLSLLDQLECGSMSSKLQMPMSTRARVLLFGLSVVLGAIIGTVFRNSDLAKGAQTDIRLIGIYCILLVIAPFFGMFLSDLPRLHSKMTRARERLGFPDPWDQVDPQMAARRAELWDRDPQWFLGWCVSWCIMLCFIGVGIMISAAWTQRGVAIFGAAYTLVNGAALLGVIVARRLEHGKGPD